MSLEINVAGTAPPVGFTCPTTPTEIKFLRLLCNSDRACENLQITINNKGCNTLQIEDILCTNGACKM